MNNYTLSLFFVLILQTVLLESSTAATIIVDTDQDNLLSVSDGQCSLREAVEAANTNLAVDTCSAGDASSIDDIRFFIPSPVTITLEGQLLVSGDTTIYGLGSSNLTIDANSAGRHFRIGNGAVDSIAVSIGHMRLINGLTSGSDTGGSIFSLRNQQVLVENVVFEDNVSSNGGGAISIDNETRSDPSPVTELTIIRCFFDNNVAQGPASGGAVSVGIGSVLSVTASTFYQNRTTHVNGNGGAILVFSDIDNVSMATVDRSTFNGNSARARGGAIWVFNGAALSVTDSTIVGNTTNIDSESGVRHGGGISLTSNVALTLENSVVAGNIDASTSATFPDIHFASSTSAFLSGGFNFIGTNDWGAFVATAGTPNGSQDLIGTNASPIDPELLALDDNGGATPTMAIGDPRNSNRTSRLIDSGNCPAATEDQRGFNSAMSGDMFLRRFDVVSVPGATSNGDACDIGAFELGAQGNFEDRDYDGVADANDDCPNHFNPSQNQVCAPDEQPDDEFCVPIRSADGAIALICL